MTTPSFHPIRSSWRACALIALFATALCFAAYAQTPAAEPLVGAVLEWKLSQVTRTSNIAVELYPDEQKQEAMQWVEIKADPSGLVDIARHRKPLASATSQVWAKARLRATVPEDRPLAKIRP